MTCLSLIPLWVYRNLFWQLSRDGNFHGLGMSHTVTTSPKLSFRAPKRVGDTVVGRRNAGWTTSKSGHSCPCQNCPKWPSAENNGRESLLNRLSCSPDDPVVKWTMGTDITEECHLSECSLAYSPADSFIFPSAYSNEILAYTYISKKRGAGVYIFLPSRSKKYSKRDQAKRLLSAVSFCDVFIAYSWREVTRSCGHSWRGPQFIPCSGN